MYFGPVEEKGKREKRERGADRSPIVGESAVEATEKKRGGERGERGREKDKGRSPYLHSSSPQIIPRPKKKGGGGEEKGEREHFFALQFRHERQ